jgi:hypothetical protein
MLRPRALLLNGPRTGEAQSAGSNRVGACSCRASGSRVSWPSKPSLVMAKAMRLGEILVAREKSAAVPLISTSARPSLAAR